MVTASLVRQNPATIHCCRPSSVTSQPASIASSARTPETASARESVAFGSFRPKLQRYVDSLAAYRKNAYGELDARWRKRIACAWQRSFDEWHYLT